MIHIYSLAEPESKNIYYVGLTTNLETRFYQHCMAPKTKTGKNLKDKNIKPILSVLESIENHLGKKKEKEWIIKLFDAGHKLENTVYKIQYPTGINGNISKKTISQIVINELEIRHWSIYRLTKESGSSMSSVKAILDGHSNYSVDIFILVINALGIELSTINRNNPHSINF